MKEAKERNPYPRDIFVGETLEGKIGRHMHDVWNNAIDLIMELFEDKFDNVNERGLD